MNPRIEYGIIVIERKSLLNCDYDYGYVIACISIFFSSMHLAAALPDS